MSDEPRVTLVKPIFSEHRAEWDRSSPHYHAQGTTRSHEVPENSLSAGTVCPESYFSMNYHLQPHQAGFPGTVYKNQLISSRSPSSIEDLNQPLETDIDEISENERLGEIDRREGEDRMEMQGFARPVIVLETDIDNMPEEGASSARNIRGPRGAFVDSILEDDYGLSRKELIGELFPHSVNTEMGGESWRGGHPISGGALERYTNIMLFQSFCFKILCFNQCVICCFFVKKKKYLHFLSETCFKVNST